MDRPLRGTRQRRVPLRDEAKNSNVPGRRGAEVLPIQREASWANAGFAGRLVDWAARTLRTTISIIRKPADQKGFAPLPRMWAVERTLAWLTGHRRLARDYERDPYTNEAMIRWAAIGLMTRRLVRGGHAVRQSPRPLEYE